MTANTGVGVSRWILAVAWIIGLFLLLPGLVSIPVSFADKAYISMPTDMNLSWRHFETVLNPRRGWLQSIGQSAAIASLSALIATLLGTLCAIGAWRTNSNWAKGVSVLVLLPMFVPPIVSALALYRAWVFLGLYDTFMGVVVAHVLLTIPFVLVTTTASLTMLDERLDFASRSLGAGTFQTIFLVIVPNIKTGIASGMFLAFMMSWDDLVVTLFISSRNVFTLPRRMWSGITENVDPAVAAISTSLILLTILIMSVQLWASAKKGRPLL